MRTDFRLSTAAVCRASLNRAAFNIALRTLGGVFALALISRPATAQTSSQPAPPAPITSSTAIPVRVLKNVVSSDTTLMTDIASARDLPNGSVIINDPGRRQLVLFDSTFRTHRVIADTSSNSPNSYGLFGGSGGMVPYVGDSTLLVDAQSAAMLVIDQTGKFARVMAPVRANDMYYVTSGQFGMAGFDPKGRLVYRTRLNNGNDMFSKRDPSGKPTVYAMPDSSPLLRADFDKRTVDTITFVKAPLERYLVVATENTMRMYPVVNPLPAGDEWTLLPDGTIAIVRGQDYHVDWLSPDGKLTSSPKMPFAWKRITLEEKQAMLDSLKKADAERVAKLPPPPPPIPGQRAMPTTPFTTVEPKDMPDFYPPVRQGQVRADPQGNVWILPSTAVDASAGLTFDVVNRKGEIVERVQLPKGRALVGFSRSGGVFMANVISPTKAAIERADIVR